MTNVTQMTTNEQQLNAALHIVARFFVEEKHDAKTGEVKNTQAYVQKAILNSLVWKADQLIERCEKETLPKAADDARRTARQHRGDEISEAQLNQRLDWIDTLKLQLMALEMFKAEALNVYTDVTGEDYYKGASAAPAISKDATGALGRLRGMGLAVPPRTDRNSPASGETGREAQSV